MSNVNSNLIFFYAWQIFVKKKKKLTFLFIPFNNDENES